MRREAADWLNENGRLHAGRGRGVVDSFTAGLKTFESTITSNGPNKFKFRYRS